MEKRYFVLKKGYLNINEEFFYFSDHGNWETCNILEETETPKLTFFYASKHIIKVIYTILVTVFSIVLIKGEVQFSGMILLVGTVIHFIDRRYKIQYFKIPLHKIERIILRENNLTIHFMNRLNKAITHTVTLDDPKETKDIQHYLQQHFRPKLNIA